MSNLPPPPPPQYGTPQPPPSGKVKLRGRIPLRLALIFAVLGIALISVGAVVLAKGSFGKVDGFERIDLSNSAQSVTFDRTGDYVGYFESPSNGRHTANVRLAIADGNDDPVEVSLYGRNGASSSALTYDLNGRHGEAVFTFTIRQSGEYQVLARSSDAPDGAQLAFGESIGTNLAAGLLLVLPGVPLVIAAIVLLIVGLVKRSNHKREREAFLAANHGR